MLAPPCANVPRSKSVSLGELLCGVVDVDEAVIDEGESSENWREIGCGASVVRGGRGAKGAVAVCVFWGRQVEVTWVPRPRGIAC